MKEYLAKFLIVDGDIQEGDWYYDRRMKTFEQATSDSNFEWLNALYPSGERVFPKFKLFLCSTYYICGDYVHAYGYDDTGTFFKPLLVVPDGDVGPIEGNWCNFSSMPDMLRRLGEFSPKATWVKDGDWFDKNEIAFTIMNKDNVFIYTGERFFEKATVPKRVEVRCKKTNEFY